MCMEKTLKEQALEAAQTLEKENPIEPAEITTPKEQKPEGSDSEPQDGNNPSEEGDKPEEESTKPEKKEEPTPSTFEVDGQNITHEDIRKWREDSENKNKWQTDLTQKAQKLSETAETLDQLKAIFVKEEKKESLTPEEVDFRKQADGFLKDPYVTTIIQEMAEKKIQERTQEENAKKTEEEKKIIQQKVVEQVRNLEKDINGSDGRPKYVDKEILEWQKENKKLYLSPQEAYEAKFRNELFEWEIQKRLKNKGGEAPKPIQANASPQRKIEGEKNTLPYDQHDRAKIMLEHLSSMNKGE